MAVDLEKRRAYARKWYRANREKVRAQQREYSRRNRDKHIARSKAWANANPDGKKNWHLRNLYGITIEDYKRMYKTQHGCCRLCGKQEKTLCVDHHHATGVIRSLLCSNCNTGLGKFREDRQLLHKAIEYLIEWEHLEN